MENPDKQKQTLVPLGIWLGFAKKKKKKKFADSTVGVGLTFSAARVFWRQTWRLRISSDSVPWLSWAHPGLDYQPAIGEVNCLESITDGTLNSSKGIRDLENAAATSLTLLALCQSIASVRKSQAVDWSSWLPYNVTSVDTCKTNTALNQAVFCRQESPQIFWKAFVEVTCPPFWLASFVESQTAKQFLATSRFTLPF